MSRIPSLIAALVWAMARALRPWKRSSTRDPLIVAVLPSYLPTTRAGSEVSMHELLRRLTARGLAVLVLTTEAEWSGEIDGVEVRPLGGNRTSVRGAHAVFTQLSARPTATMLAAWYDSRLVVFQKMGTLSRLAAWSRPDLVVYNSDWLEAKHAGRSATCVLHPMIDVEAVRVERGGLITMVGLNEIKGGDVFWKIAQRQPSRRFLAVRNAYGEQIVPESLPPNVEIVGPVEDIRDVYGRTRLLLMPSRFETFGRVGIEASASGIPVIAHPSPGLFEALGESAVWVDRSDIDAWVEAIGSLDDEAVYVDRSVAVRTNADAFDPGAELHRLLEMLGLGKPLT